MTVKTPRWRSSYGLKISVGAWAPQNLCIGLQGLAGWWPPKELLYAVRRSDPYMWFNSSLFGGSVCWLSLAPKVDPSWKKMTVLSRHGYVVKIVGALEIWRQPFFLETLCGSPQHPHIHKITNTQAHVTASVQSRKTAYTQALRLHLEGKKKTLIDCLRRHQEI